jgi:hypothetical protein
MPKTQKVKIQKEEPRIRLNILKSHVPMNVICRDFIITSDGLPCSQKTHNTHFVSVGRQQINDQGIRPNDIMLFPTDPSISRTHFKIYHKEFFNKLSDFNTVLNEIPAMMGACLLNEDLVRDILGYIKPNQTFTIEDNGTIYGTYVKIRPFTIENIMANLYLNFKQGKLKLGSFDFIECLKILEKYPNDNERGFLITMLMLKEKITERYFYFRNIEYIPFENLLYSLAELVGIGINDSDLAILKNNNFTLNDESVYLITPRNGFIVSKSGSIAEIITNVKLEFQEFSLNNNPQGIELITYDPIIEEATLENNTYRVVISKQDLIASLSQMSEFFKDYTAIHIVETFGDPCGIMNRVHEAIFFMNTKQVHNKVFSFNNMEGYLLGNTQRCQYTMNTESEIFIYYSKVNDGWMMSDLTKFTNPEIYVSDDYHGVWGCISPDKKNEHRFKPKPYEIRSDDQIKISETVFKVKIEQP